MLSKFFSLSTIKPYYNLIVESVRATVKYSSHISTSLQDKYMVPPMTRSEAMEILNLKDLNDPRLDDHFVNYFKANAISKGGSFYVQSKIFRAKEHIEKLKSS